MYVIPRQTRIMDVACTRNHNVAVSTSGEVYAPGALVISPSREVTPELVGALRGKHVTAVSAGLTHAAAVADAGDFIYTWDVSTDGTGNASGLGHLNLVDGNATTKKIPQSVHTLKRVTAVACGDTHTAAVVTTFTPTLGGQ